MSDFIIGFILSFFISIIAYKKESLSLSGFFTAILISTFLYFFGTFILWSTLMMFFISSSLLTKFKERDKTKHMSANEKGGRRDYLQVLANGFLPVLFAFLYYLTDNLNFSIASAVSIATSNSDTWASELGVLSKGKTWSITKFKPVQKGLSGGVSVFGTLAASLGALLIALTYAAQLYFIETISITGIIPIFLIVTFGGIIGCFVDSYLGATVQAKYRCPICDEVIEYGHHHNVKSELKSGFIIFTNDMVNMTSSFTSSVVILTILI